jgi:hypothetical protein
MALKDAADPSIESEIADPPATLWRARDAVKGIGMARLGVLDHPTYPE